MVVTTIIVSRKSSGSKQSGCFHLWHKTIVMEPPEELDNSQLILGWTTLDSCCSGQGLVDVRNRICAFRIQAAQRFLYDKDVLWEKTASAIMRRVGGFGLDKQLFLMNLEEINVSELTVFTDLCYKHVIRTENLENLEHCAREEPLFLIH